jgi:ABC-2 type transport system permease protein
MNALTIFRFEFRYRQNRPATYLYFALLLVLSFCMVGTDLIKSLAGGAVKDNATLVMARVSLMLFLIMGVLISSAIMGVAVVRDFEHRTDALFFTKPIRRWEFLAGRYVGSLVVLLLTLTAIPLGLMLGETAPWREADRLLPFRAATYWHPYVTLLIPNALIAGTVFFAVGALSRRMLVVFTQGMVFLMLYLLSNRLLGQLDRRDLAALLEPFGLGALSTLTRYWSISQQNTKLVPLVEQLLWNRLLWLGIAGGVLAATFGLFSYQQVSSGPRWLARFRRNKAAAGTPVAALNLRQPLPTVDVRVGRLGNLWQLTSFYARVVMKDLPFLALSIGGIGMFLFSAFDTEGDWYGSRMLPTTYLMLGKMSIFTGLFLFILMIIYVGDLVWKERDVRFDLINDSLPVPGWMLLLGKYLGLGLAFGLMLTLTMGLGALMQAALGGGLLIEWRVYAQSLYGDVWLGLLVFMLLGFFVHVLVNHKFAGHGLLIVFFIAIGVLSYLGIEHKLLLFGSASLGTYSDMNGFGHYVTPFSWQSLYWLAFAALLFAGAVVLSVRGADTLLKLRLQVGRHRLTRPILTFVLGTLVVFVSSGSYIFYNTNVLNRYQNSEQDKADQANYEKTLKRYATLPQPRITAIDVHIDLYPDTRDFSAKGQYTLLNKTAQPIRQLHLQTYPTDDFEVKRVQLSTHNQLDTRYVADYGYRMYTLAKPLQPGDSLRLNFELRYHTQGFRNGNANTDIVQNGTFFTNDYLPGIGYNDGYELGGDDDRKEHGLKPRERLREATDPVGLAQSVHGDDADLIRFAITVSTAADQTAIAPGYLKKEWTRGGRRYFQYAMDAPINNFFSIVSARYAVKRDQLITPGREPVSLAIYHHHGHTQNLDRMMQGMKAALTYYQTQFGAYQHRQLRIMEFPRYRSYAQSFANTIPFGEDMGFVANIDDRKDIDTPFFVTAHEVAHQWWGHQVIEANVKGSGLLSESLAEYSALMVMKHHYPMERTGQFLRYELDYYLSGRRNEARKEQPLTRCENQQYIHYNKGAVVLYALQDQIGEARLNRALRTYRDRWNTAQVAKTGRYPTAADLMREIQAVTPDSLNGLVDDWFNAITLYELKTEKVQVKPVGKQYAVTLDISAQKVRADSLGNETSRPLKEWMWVGVYADKARDTDPAKLLYYQRHLIRSGQQQVSVRVNQKPAKAGIDPLLLLIDRHPGDNVKSVE